MNKINRIKELVEILQKASLAYYQYDNPIMSDKQYDDLYDELEQLEKETNCILAGSPTQKVQGYILKGLEKQKHSKPMLSAAKTKDVKEIKKFINWRDFYGSYKLDGLTLVVIFEAGELKTALTRGSGVDGEVVTESAKMIRNLPKRIDYQGKLEIRGECVVSWDNFNYINEKLTEPFSHPRNMAAGSIRNLNTAMARDRMLEFVAFECVTDIGIDDKFLVLQKLEELGFTVVERIYGESEEKCPVDYIVEQMTPEASKYPIDGLIFEINSRKESEAMGATSHHECCRYALKHKDETYETVFKGIEWSTTRTGLVNPVAIFDTVNIQGSDVSKATLHNLSYIEELELGEGDIIEVYKANMIIPKVHDNLTRSNTWTYPTECPSCGSPTEIHNENGSKTLHCTNPNCSAKFISKLVNFVSKQGMNIDGLSEATLSLLVNKEFIAEYRDIFHLNERRVELARLPKMGAKSVDKLLKNIEHSRKVDFAHFLASLSVPGVGVSTAKDIAKYCGGSIENFIFIISNTSLEFTNIDGIGSTVLDAMESWWEENAEVVLELLEDIEVIVPEKKAEKIPTIDMSNKSFVITGSLNHFENRDALKNLLESLGAKVSGSVSKNTFALICNEKDSNTGKSKKAKDLGVNVWTEDELLKYIGV